MDESLPSHHPSHISSVLESRMASWLAAHANLTLYNSTDSIQTMINLYVLRQYYRWEMKKVPNNSLQALKE